MGLFVWGVDGCVSATWCCMKRGLLEEGLLKKVDVLEILKSSLQNVEKKQGESDESLKSLEVLKVKRPLLRRLPPLSAVFKIIVY